MWLYFESFSEHIFFTLKWITFEGTSRFGVLSFRAGMAEGGVAPSSCSNRLGARPSVKAHGAMKPSRLCSTIRGAPWGEEYLISFVILISNLSFQTWSINCKWINNSWPNPLWSQTIKKKPIKEQWYVLGHTVDLNRDGTKTQIFWFSCCGNLSHQVERRYQSIENGLNVVCGLWCLTSIPFYEDVALSLMKVMNY